MDGDILCDGADWIFEDVESTFEQTITSKVNAKLPEAFNEALEGINVSGTIGAALEMDIDPFYTSVPEDSQGVTFVLSSNITAVDPLPDAPLITATLLPSSPGSPVLGPTVPSSGLSYDLGFCLSDGFLNRAMAALVQKGSFAESVTEVPTAGGPLPLTTFIVGLAADPDDGAYAADCPGCPVTLVLKPTVAPIARAPEGGEGGTVVLVVPNYQIDVVANDHGSPRTQLTGLVTFSLPLTLDFPPPIAVGYRGAELRITAGTPVVNDVRVASNPIGANEAAFAAAVEALLPENAASALGGLLREIALPPFEGLALTGRATGYNVGCTALYMNLSEAPSDSPPVIGQRVE
jgi:hypothetical protein